MLTAKEFGLDFIILDQLKDVKISIIDKHSDKLLFGEYRSKPQPYIQIFRYNYGSRLPDPFFGIYNQAGMDHELIGHGYNLLKNNSLDEQWARDMQKNMALLRGNDSALWNMTARIQPSMHYLFDKIK